ncbi:hypothetical protein PS273GM_14205 [Stutzerimonas stutzeri]|uniref:Uncharacterized protein n=1 Tax=Stutzerimonas stutzeri TaxID=316 RepID=A0A172WRZ8_STUST|nr:hypothetical protein PS273GM_14205 [Stutzerimonas stutzeri]
MAAVIASKVAHTSTTRAVHTLNTGNIPETCRLAIRGSFHRSTTIVTAGRIGITGTMGAGARFASRSGGKMIGGPDSIAHRVGSVITRETLAGHL